jgi:hypothetical protein
MRKFRNIMADSLLRETKESLRQGSALKLHVYVLTLDSINACSSRLLCYRTGDSCSARAGRIIEALSVMTMASTLRKKLLAITSVAFAALSNGASWCKV